MEWSDPLGLRGCGFCHIVDGKTVFQCGCWDKLSFLRLHGLKLPIAYIAQQKARRGRRPGSLYMRRRKQRRRNDHRLRGGGSSATTLRMPKLYQFDPDGSGSV